MIIRAGNKVIDTTGRHVYLGAVERLDWGPGVATLHERVGLVVGDSPMHLAAAMHNRKLKTKLFPYVLVGVVDGDTMRSPSQAENLEFENTLEQLRRAKYERTHRWEQA